MNDTKETQVEQHKTYSRRQRDDKGASHFEQADNRQVQALEEGKRPRRFRLGAAHHFQILLLSMVLTLLTVVLPYMSSLATDYQQFNLYTGTLMTKNQLPYSDIFATGGFLFYALIGISQILGSQLYLLGVQFLALYVAGIYLYKIVFFYTDDTASSMAAGIAFYLGNLALGFGGLYPMQWAAPFVLMGLWFLIRYFAGMTKDEGFILYGLHAALALVLEPKTLLFWLLAYVLLSGYNLSKKRFARGFYQNLAIILGLILVFYTVGYFIFNLEVTIPYLTQVLGYNFTHLAWGTGILWQTALLQVGLAFFSGLLLGALVFFEHIRKAESDYLSRVLIFLSLLAYVTLAVMSKSWAFYQLLLALPFGLILTIISLDGFAKQRQSRKNSHRRREDERSLWGTFLFSHLAGPVLLVLVAVALPFYQRMTETARDDERVVLASYLKENTADAEKVVVIDDKADVYLLSGRQTATHYPVASLYQASEDRIKEFEDDFLGSQSKFVIVNKNLTLSQSVKDSLAKNYNQMTIEGLEHFALYQLK